MADRSEDGAEPSARRRGQGELEAQVLAVLREASEPVPVAWVRERLGGGLAYTTVITILTRLRAKGAVERERAGRSFRWTAVADEAGLAALRMRKVLDAEADRQAVLASFVTALSPNDERLLRELLSPEAELPSPEAGEEEG
ncbi:BlaI/MecI/CopY family transcriptional regulator [Streptomyces sp. WAC08241]|uniref:BlaI/MecI/CopY family transcriptional regulator n=1 Tax=Streptomyces sp. WAC08241 TaxID=2487421 RepID=UPI000F7B0B71|nr:BlaI/MecI/CopY family transcriptional regulator [Streptomyces sp. WAC08241]RSS39517.1 BlaI/MecI/CopY family transcriptional regulator [Streptomyces sp. WAC08241]